MQHASNELCIAMKEFVGIFRPDVPEEDVVKFVARIADGFVPNPDEGAQMAGTAKDAMDGAASAASAVSREIDEAHDPWRRGYML